MNDRWQYEVIEFKPKMLGGFNTQAMREELDRLGRQGWELVSFSQPAPTSAACAVFKKKAG
ncbi:DUF4177 domain-containing protein [Luteimonas sp. e5]